MPTTTPTRRAPKTAFKPGNQINPTGLSRLHSQRKSFLSKSFDEQRKVIDATWLELCYLVPQKALDIVLDDGKKSASKVRDLVTAAAIAKDKRFPEEDSGLLIRIPARLLAGFTAAIHMKSASEKSIACAVSAVAHQAIPDVGQLPKSEDCGEKSTGSVPT